MSGHEIYKSKHKIRKTKKEQQKRKIQQFHPEIEDGTDLRRWPLIGITIIGIYNNFVQVAIN